MATDDAPDGGGAMRLSGKSVDGGGINGSGSGSGTSVRGGDGGSGSGGDFATGGAAAVVTPEKLVASFRKRCADACATRNHAACMHAYTHTIVGTFKE